jgi:hypothetical protein
VRTIGSNDRHHHGHSDTGRSIRRADGDNFSIGSLSGGTGSFTPQQCFPCAPGSTLNITGFFGGSTLGAGSANINGTLFTNLGGGVQMFRNEGSVHNLSLESRPARQSVCGGATHAAESFTVLLNLLFNTCIKHFSERLFIASPFLVDDDS